MAERNYCECCDASRFLNEKKLCRNCADRIEAEHIKFRAALEKELPCNIFGYGTQLIERKQWCDVRIPLQNDREIYQYWCDNCRARKAVMEGL